MIAPTDREGPLSETANTEKPRRFGNSVAICFRKYLVFQGRAPRAEFWWFVLFTIICSGVAALVNYALFGESEGIVTGIVEIALLLPGLSVQVRRLHDIDRSGWWYWLFLIPIVGWIILLVWNCKRGTPGPNRYGPDPLGGFGVGGYAVA
jgi:uncharacterized membrane protein YhaH (DUF805 family)